MTDVKLLLLHSNTSTYFYCVKKYLKFVEKYH